MIFFGLFLRFPLAGDAAFSLSACNVNLLVFAAFGRTKPVVEVVKDKVVHTYNSANICCFIFIMDLACSLAWINQSIAEPLSSWTGRMKKKRKTPKHDNTHHITHHLVVAAFSGCKFWDGRLTDDSGLIDLKKTSRVRWPRDAKVKTIRVESSVERVLNIDASYLV